MDKKREKIIKFLEKASVYASKSQDSLNEALKVALYGKGLTKKEMSLLSVSYATGEEEVVERINDGFSDDEPFSQYDSDIRDKSILQIYDMTGDQIRELYNL